MYLSVDEMRLRRRPRMPFWTNDPVRDAEAYDRYLCELEEQEEEDDEALRD